MGVTSPCDPETEGMSRGGEHTPFSEKATERLPPSHTDRQIGSHHSRRKARKAGERRGHLRSALMHFVSYTLKDARMSHHVCLNLFCIRVMGIAPELAVLVKDLALSQPDYARVG